MWDQDAREAISSCRHHHHQRLNGGKKLASLLTDLKAGGVGVGVGVSIGPC